jgi:hypothetical protein
MLGLVFFIIRAHTVLFADKQKSGNKVLIQEMFPELMKDGNFLGRAHPLE